MIDLTPKYNLLPAKDKLVFPEGELAEVSGGWAFGATEQKKGGNVLDSNLRVVPPGGDIQKAIDELNAIGAGTILLQRGTHTLTQTLTGYSKISIIGEGRDQTIIECGGNAYGITYAGVSATIKNNFVLSDFTLQNSNNAAGIDIDYCDFWKIENVRVTSCDQDGINIDHARNWNLYNCRSDNNTSDGIIIYGDDTRVTNVFSLINIECDSNGTFGLETLFNGNNGVQYGSYINCAAHDNSSSGIVSSGSIYTDNVRSSYISCLSFDNSGNGFNVGTQHTRLIGCDASGNTSDDYTVQTGLNVVIGCDTSSPGDTVLAGTLDVIVGSNIGFTTRSSQKHFWMKNTSGSTINMGNVVVSKAAAAGDEITTTTTQGDDKVFGIAMSSFPSGGYEQILTEGFTTRLTVDGTTDIAIGDLLGTFTTAGIAMKAAAGDMCFAIALEAYTTNDSLGVIDSLIISPRLI